MFSAIKQNGNPLYYWARKGVYLYREPRRIEVMNMELIDRLEDQAKIRVSCSKGTYIRTLVEQLGRGLGSLATVVSLRRLEVGQMKIHNNFCKLEEPKESLIGKILPCDALLEEIEKIELNSEDVKKVRNGLSIDYNAHLKNKGLVRIYSKKKLFIGLGQVYKNNKIKPKRLLATN
jgi:tRNA pseudouridine55 synthase